MRHIEFSDIITTITASCALIVTGILGYRQFIVQDPVIEIGTPVPPVLIGGEDSLAATGYRRGAANPIVTIVEFADFECPFCKSFAEGDLAEFLAKNVDAVRLVYRYWPLPMHRFAYPAARAAECAGGQDTFWPMHDALYESQDSLGLLSFHDLAQRAGVPDLAAFDSCYSTPGRLQVVDRDAVVAEGIGGRGTPTIVINGWRFNGIPPSGTLDSILTVARGK